MSFAPGKFDGPLSNHVARVLNIAASLRKDVHDLREHVDSPHLTNAINELHEFELQIKRFAECLHETGKLENERVTVDWRKP